MQGIWIPAATTWARLGWLAAGGMAVAGLSGCTTAMMKATGVLSVEQAPEYARLAPFEFTRQRFFEEEKTPVLDAILGRARKEDKVGGDPGRELPEPPRRPHVLAEAKLVTWTAYFNDVNYIQLLRPAIELRRYCEARQGQWTDVERFMEDPLATMRRNPLAAYVDAYGRVTRHLQARGAYIGFEEMRGVIATKVGDEMAEMTRAHNDFLSWQFSAAGFRNSQKLASFGSFSCEQQDGRWFATVMPVLLIGRDPKNKMDSSEARLTIRIYDSRPPGALPATIPTVQSGQAGPR